MKQQNTKHLQLRGNVWWLYYKIPKRLKSLPQFEHYPAIYAQSLKTDSLVKARRFRNSIIHNLNDVPVDPHEAWEKEITKRSEEFRERNKHLEETLTYEDILQDEVLTGAINQSGNNKITGHPLALNEEQQIKLDVLAQNIPEKQKGLVFLTKKVIQEREAIGQAPKTLSQIKRASNWLLEQLNQNDINIVLIEYDQVHSFVIQELNTGVASMTISGYLSGLRQVWNRAKESNIVSGDNPFSSHKIGKSSRSYDPFTYDEIFTLYDNANGNLKTLIHAGATTGARLNELLTAEVKTVSTFDSPCWLFKFKDRGKTAHSTRVVPIHPSLNLPEGFSFNVSSSTIDSQFRNLRKEILGEPIHELTGNPRKLSFHSFRSTVVTYLTADKRINEKVVGSITGHLGGGGSAGSIRTYINPDDLQMKLDVVSQLPWVELDS
jgi:integrase